MHYNKYNNVSSEKNLKNNPWTYDYYRDEKNFICES